MNAPRKFLFDKTFEGPEKAGAPQRAEQKPVVKTYTEEELNKAREDGLAAGKQAGQQAAQNSMEQQVAQALTSMTQQVAELNKAHATAVERQGHEAIETALTIVRKLFPRLAKAHGMAEIEAVVGESLSRLRDEPRVVVRVADSLLDAVNERVKELAAKAGFEGRIVLIAQDDLQAGDIRVEWADGGAERDSGALWHQIDDIIERVMGTPCPVETTTHTGATAPSDTTGVEDAQELDRLRAVSQ
ncbi:MAG TPA: FliH/SctL family protein [Kiloniellales bacterium]|jgi:flagellar assembly protein FliH